MMSAAGAQPDPHVLREYALIADGERGAVVGPRGDLCWMCFPRWHSDACFATLIGGDGTYAVTPLDRFVWGGYYEQGLIWRNRWVTDNGTVECREALALPASAGRAVLLRQIHVLEGSARIRVALDLRAEFGRRRIARVRQDEVRLNDSDEQLMQPGARSFLQDTRRSARHTA